MTVSDWAGTPENWVFLVIGLGMLFAGFRVVTSPNVVHAVLYLVAALGGTAALFLLLGAEFVAWTVVLVYIGAVVVLFLFGIMITRAPVGREVQLSHPIRVRVSAAIVAFALFVLLAASVVGYFEDAVVAPSAATRTDDIGQAMFERFVMPFEVVSIVLLAALIGGIVLARRDPTEESEALR